MAKKNPNSLEKVNGWKEGAKKSNAEKLGRPPTKKEIIAQKWRAKALSSVKDNTVAPEGADVDVTTASLQFLEAWNEYCGVMEQLNGEIYKALFKNSIEAGKRSRQALKKQKALIALMIKASLLFEQQMMHKRKLAKDSTKNIKNPEKAAESNKRRKYKLKDAPNKEEAVDDSIDAGAAAV